MLAPLFESFSAELQDLGGLLDTLLCRCFVSPIRFLGRNRFLGLCLSREEPRQFCLDRCRNVRLASAADFLMPMAMAG